MKELKKYCLNIFDNDLVSGILMMIIGSAGFIFILYLCNYQLGPELLLGVFFTVPFVIVGFIQVLLCNTVSFHRILRKLK